MYLSLSLCLSIYLSLSCLFQLPFPWWLLPWKQVVCLLSHNPISDLWETPCLVVLPAERKCTVTIEHAHTYTPAPTKNSHMLLCPPDTTHQAHRHTFSFQAWEKMKAPTSMGRRWYKKRFLPLGPQVQSGFSHRHTGIVLSVHCNDKTQWCWHPCPIITEHWMLLCVLPFAKLKTSMSTNLQISLNLFKKLLFSDSLLSYNGCILTYSTKAPMYAQQKLRPGVILVFTTYKLNAMLGWGTPITLVTAMKR